MTEKQFQLALRMFLISSGILSTINANKKKFTPEKMVDGMLAAIRSFDKFFDELISEYCQEYNIKEDELVLHVERVIAEFSKEDKHGS